MVCCWGVAMLLTETVARDGECAGSDLNERSAMVIDFSYHHHKKCQTRRQSQPQLAVIGGP